MNLVSLNWQTPVVAVRGNLATHCSEELLCQVMRMIIRVLLITDSVFKATNNFFSQLI